MLRSYSDPWAKTFCGAELVLCLVRCSVKLWCGPLSGPICLQTTTRCGVCGSLVVAQENPTDATTLRAAIIKTHAKITGDQIKSMIGHFTRPAVDDMYEGVTIA